MTFIHCPAVIRHARVALSRSIPRTVLCRDTGDLEIRVALVVPKKNVVLRAQGLDEIVFQQERLGLGAHHRRFQPRNSAHHMANARASVLLAEVAADPLFQVARLADI